MTAIALAGTARHPAAGDRDVAHAAEALIPADAAADAEALFLLRAGVHAVYAAAGQVPQVVPAAVQPAPADAAPYSSIRLMGLLQNAMATDAKLLLADFLAQMHGTGLLAPPELLPDLLNMADAEVRTQLLPVLGERGRWLARLNPAWDWVQAGGEILNADDEQTLQREWDEGTIANRCRVLATWRGADPDAARERLAAAFPREKADYRVRLLRTLAANLSISDEPFLERCLNDRSTNVRDVAVAFLVTIPTSALAGRMRTRGDAMFDVATQKRLWKGLKLGCAPPQNIDKAWERDGVPKQAPPGRGKRALWAEIVLSCVSPTHWTTQFAATPQILIKAVQTDTFAEPVLSGWTNAAVRFAATNVGCAAWFVSLADHWSAAAVQLRGEAQRSAFGHLGRLLPVMPAAESERIVAGLLETAVREHQTVYLLAELARPWSSEFGRAYLRLANAALGNSNDGTAYWWANSLPMAARALPRELFAAAQTAFDTESGAATRGANARGIERFHDLLRLRQSFFDELASDNQTEDAARG